ncbi:MAG TPA: hypothetical protein HPP69_09155 [Deltaproteobacteria bacterium]|nr:hypothetical protein [Deltaproteobacteria bacterium]
MEIIRVFKTVAPQAICFDMGCIDEIPNISPVYEMVKEPFPTCWFEANFTHTDGKQIIIGLLVIVREEVQITSFRRKNKKWQIRGGIVAESLSDWQKYEIFPDHDYSEKEIEQHKLILSTFLSALNCNNVKRVEHTPEPKLQKSRKKRGKLPIFSHWTLELSIPKETDKNQTLKGTHSSPRVHLRRGHPRQYAPGKYTWVQPCIVGKSNGIVTKDYSAKYKNNE